MTGEGEDQLRDAGVEMACDFMDQRVADDFDVRGEQRKALVGDVVLAAEGADFAVPSEASEAAVLHEGGWFRHLLKMMEADVADANLANTAGFAVALHGRPDFVVRVGPVIAGRGAMEKIAIKISSVEMFE